MVSKNERMHTILNCTSSNYRSNQTSVAIGNSIQTDDILEIIRITQLLYTVYLKNHTNLKI